MAAPCDETVEQERSVNSRHRRSIGKVLIQLIGVGLVGCRTPKHQTGQCHLGPSALVTPKGVGLLFQHLRPHHLPPSHNLH
ncbi:hypothetical protein KCV03_g289, partial [Aureobasidium melanogenum]